MWLVLDDVAIERYFGKTFQKAFGAVQAFAAANNCTFDRVAGTRSVRLGRAYYLPGGRAKLEKLARSRAAASGIQE